ncbi:MAG: hypothetical protein TU35_008990 [Thermoproteus sp. AZ2]|jgi:hypothetical protein|uniref:Uncharacterized protein n=1 Tax=Thermoproteus sp. AZ2 TaxID=1609232 RepID=A0ACC6V3X1_9CREN
MKNKVTIYEDLIMRVYYVGDRWLVAAYWAQGGFSHEVYVNGSLFYYKPGATSVRLTCGLFRGEGRRA